MKKFIKTKTTFLAIILIIVAFGLRLINLDKLPSVMHRDELAIAYNAYSILETGHDEWGERWPLAFKSFGDYKLPGLIYSTVLGIKLFGLNPFGARVISTILSSMAIPLMFLFSKKLFKSRLISLIATLLLTFSFWHLSGSRNIYEPIVALSFSVISYITLLTAIKKPWHLLFSVLFFAISIWFYHTPLLIYPAIFTFWAWHNWPQFTNSNKKLWMAVFLLMILVAGFNIFAMTRLNKSRSETTIFMSQELKDAHQSRMHQYWVAGIPLHPIFTHTERVAQVLYYFVQGYIKGISPDFLFFTGGNNYWHNLQSINLGNINPILLPFVIIGLIELYKNRKKSTNFFLLSLLILSPIPNALTVDSPNTNRLLDFHFMLLITAAFGFYSFCTNKTLGGVREFWLKKSIIIITIGLYTWFSGQFLARYFLIYNFSLHSTWNEGFPELIRAVEKNRNRYDKVFVTTQTKEPYIFFLFYNQYPPQNLTAIHTAQIENIYFGNTLDSSQNSSQYKNEKILAVTPPTNQTQENLIFKINNWEGKPIWQGFEWSYAKK